MTRALPSLVTQRGTNDAGEGQSPGEKSLKACYVHTVFTPILLLWLYNPGRGGQVGYRRFQVPERQAGSHQLGSGSACFLPLRLQKKVSCLTALLYRRPREP